MKNYKFKIVIILMVSFLFPICGICEENVVVEETTLYRILEKQTVLAMNYWDLITEEYLGIVTEHTEKFENDLINVRTLSFYKKVGDRLIRKYEYTPGDNFIGMYPLKDAGGNMLTIWEGGSSYHINIFSLINNEIRIVLEAGSKALPEIADIDNDGEYEILIWAGDFEVLKTKENEKLVFFEKKRIFKWKTADIYKWNGKSYKLIKKVLWENRLNSLKRR